MVWAWCSLFCWYIYIWSVIPEAQTKMSLSQISSNGNTYTAGCSSSLPSSPRLAGLAGSIHKQVACRMKELPVLEVSATNEGSSEDKGLVSTHNHMKQVKSGKQGHRFTSSSSCFVATWVGLHHWKSAKTSMIPHLYLSSSVPTCRLWMWKHLSSV